MNNFKTSLAYSTDNKSKPNRLARASTSANLAFASASAIIDAAENAFIAFESDLPPVF